MRHACDRGQLARDRLRVVVEPPRDATHGDMATNAAMVLAREAQAKPRDLAEKIAEKLARLARWLRPWMSPDPGFINLTLKTHVWADALRTVLSEDAGYGRSGIGNAEKVNVRRYVSANPTGPMHVGHCRGAVFGDAMCSLLQFAGYDVTHRVLHQRRRRAGRRVGALGIPPLPRGAGRGHRPDTGGACRRLSEAGRAGARQRTRRPAAVDAEKAWLPIVHDKAIAMMMEEIKGDLAALNIRSDLLGTLVDRDREEQGVTETIDFLRSRGDI